MLSLVCQVCSGSFLLPLYILKQIQMQICQLGHLYRKYISADSVNGPIVALTNESAGSDGDIFSHAFKLLNIGPVIGTRTWGGVVGINPRRKLVDGTTVTQPEFALWFGDVGFGIENHGAEPETVEYMPQDYQSGNDPQLDMAIRKVMELLEEKGHLVDFREDAPGKHSGK